jgi:hypothetical protein
LGKVVGRASKTTLEYLPGFAGWRTAGLSPQTLLQDLPQAFDAEVMEVNGTPTGLIESLLSPDVREPEHCLGFPQITHRVIAQDPVDVISHVVSQFKSPSSTPVGSLFEKGSFVRRVVPLVGPPSAGLIGSKMGLDESVVQINTYQFLIGPDPDLLLAMTIGCRVIGPVEDQVTVPMNPAGFPLGQFKRFWR